MSLCRSCLGAFVKLKILEVVANPGMCHPCPLKEHKAVSARLCQVLRVPEIWAGSS